MESNKQIEEQALAWLARRDSGRLGGEELQAFEEWLRDDAHRVLFLRLELVWERSARLKAIGVGRIPGVVPPPGQWRSAPFFENRSASRGRAAVKAWGAKIAVAAAVLLAVGAGVYFTRGSSGDAYSTPAGGVATIPLKDGSNMMLNTASRVRVSLSEKERRIELEVGEAFFDVAKDPVRPFVVDVGDRKVIAVGTRFSVRREGSGMQVVVTEGKVRIEPGTNGEDAQFLTAGAIVKSTHDGALMRRRSAQEAEDALSWRSGYITFEEASLADAVAEVNRYALRRIVIEDPKLAALRVNGKFRTTHAEDMVEMLRNGFGVPVRETTGAIYLGVN